MERKYALKHAPSRSSSVRRMHTQSSLRMFGTCLLSLLHAAAASIDGLEVAAGSFVELREGQEVEFEDGKRYIVRVDGEKGLQTLIHILNYSAFM